MTGRTLDMAIVGGGLAGGLAALAVHQAHPGMQIGLFEAGDVYGGNHRWSWFESDLEGPARDLLAPFPQVAWTSGYDVAYPRFERTLASSYLSLASRDFDAVLRRKLPQETLRLSAPVARLAGDGIVLDSGEQIAARVVVDCRDGGPSPHLDGGWQVFMGHHLRMREPHSQTRPIVMDARVEQHGAYRFVYTLPLSETELFVEDTYYADRPHLDRAALAQRIAAYCHEMGWRGEIVGEETGVLPVITGGDFTAYRRDLGPAGVVHAGARGGFVHPLTSYTLPFATDNALALAAMAQLPGPQIADSFEKRAQAHWRDTAFYRHLARMLLLGARPEERYRIFEHFYRLPEPLVERFYAGSSTLPDKARVLIGKPPIPIPRAIRALLGKGAPLVHGEQS